MVIVTNKLNKISSNDNYGIKKGHLETIHAYTNDQNLVDNMHTKHRRGRALEMFLNDIIIINLF